MATAVSICSNALMMLGESPINSFADGNNTNGLDRARLCANFWPTVRDFVLRSHPWNCATKRVVMSPESDAPEYGYSSRFALPGDWLRNIEINNSASEVVDHVIEDNKLMMDGDTLRLRYVYRNEDPASWDPLLVNAAEYAMSARLAYPITASTTIVQIQTQLFADALKLARAIDGQDESPGTLGDFAVLQARYR